MLFVSRRSPDCPNSPVGVAALSQQKRAQMEPWGLFFYFGTTHIGLIHLAALAAQCSCLMGGPHLRIT